MRAPRRVPWATRAELDELYDLVFSSDADETMKMRGLERMSVYISSPSCPAFMPILYGLVSADLLPAPRNVVEAQSTRLSCGMAIVRLINGMVDPLQTGPYAKPISHLAATLHIPPALIALRHRATHEDLPPLPLLRASVIQCISYLHTYSFLPLLAESSTAQLHPASAGAADAAGSCYHNDNRASQLVARYKRISKDKARDRDVDESGARAKDLRRIQRGLEVEDTRDVVRALCSTEGLVPVARKKRPKVMTEFEPTEGSVKLWGPLLRHLAPYHPSLADVLAQHIVRVLLEPGTGTGTVPVVGREDAGAGSKEEMKEQTSYRWALAVWLIHMWSPVSRPRGLDLQLGRDEKRAVWGSLLPVLVPGTPILRRLASCLAEADPSIASGWFQLERMLPTTAQDAHSAAAAVAGRSGGNDGLRGLEIPGDIDMAVFGADGSGPVMPGAAEEEVAGTGGLDDALERMQARMAQFEQMMSGGKTSSTGSEAEAEAEADADGTNGAAGKDMAAAPGWRRLTPREWKPCPVGMSGLA